MLPLNGHELWLMIEAVILVFAAAKLQIYLQRRFERKERNRIDVFEVKPLNTRPMTPCQDKEVVSPSHNTKKASSLRAR